MLNALFAGLRFEAHVVARRTALVTGGAIFLFVGLTLLSVAGWIVVSEMRDAVFATLVFAGVYSGIGLILIGLSRRPPRIPTAAARSVAAPTAAATPAVAFLPVVEAFATGFYAGSRRGK